MKLFHWGPKNEPFVRYYKRNFGKFEGPWPPIINAMVLLMGRLETEIDSPPLSCSTSHTTVIFARPDINPGFVCWLTYGLTFIDGTGGRGDVPAYFIRDSDNIVHRAESVEGAIGIIVKSLQKCEAKQQIETDESRGDF